VPQVDVLLSAACTDRKEVPRASSPSGDNVVSVCLSFNSNELEGFLEVSSIGSNKVGPVVAIVLSEGEVSSSVDLSSRDNSSAFRNNVSLNSGSSAGLNGEVLSVRFSFSPEINSVPYGSS